MGKMKNLSLQFVGYKIKGEATLNMWGGGRGAIEMKETFIPADKLKPSALKQAVNDNGFGCESIAQALVDVYRCYGGMDNLYEQFDRTIVLNKNQCQEGLNGI